MAADRTNDPSVAREGISLLFRSGVEDAEALLTKNSGGNAQIDCALAYIRVVQSLLSWEPDSIDVAIDYLKQVEARCSASESSLPSIGTPRGMQHLMLLRVIDGDCQLLRALLCFTKLSIAGYVKGGLLLRSASKVYKKIYKDLDKYEGTQSSVNDAAEGASASFANVRAACSLGFGIVNLAMSLMPDKALSLMKFFGFSGERQAGLDALAFSSTSEDMRAPVAMLSLAWFHGIGRPLLGIDVREGYGDAIDQAQKIIHQAETDMGPASIFNYFKGRTEYLKNNTELAMEAFKSAASSPSALKEVSQLCLYEMGFIHVLNKDFAAAAPNFETLCKETHWSPGFYGYLAALCLGSDGQIAAAHDLMKKLPSIVLRKNANYEKFVLKKTACFQKAVPTVVVCRTLLYEVVYLWNYMLFANTKQKEELLDLLQDECGALDPLDHVLLAANFLVQAGLTFELSRPLDAEVFSRKVLQHADICVKKKEQHIPAYATFIIGQIYQQSGDFVQMKQAMSKAKSAYSDYEVEGRLQTKIKIAMESAGS